MNTNIIKIGKEKKKTVYGIISLALLNYCDFLIFEKSFNFGQ